MKDTQAPENNAPEPAYPMADEPFEPLDADEPFLSSDGTDGETAAEKTPRGRLGGTVGRVKTLVGRVNKTVGRVGALCGQVNDGVARFADKTALAPGIVIELLVCGFLAASALSLLGEAEYTSVGFLESVSIPLFLGVLALVSAGLGALTAATKKTKPVHWTLFVLALLFAALLTGRLYANLYICLGAAFAVVVIVRYLTAQDRLELGKIAFSERQSMVLTCLACAGFTGIVTLFTYCRHTSFDSATYDFGIFTQMFEYMRTTGLPLTTVEREGLTSHFSVHFSPFFYLLLPGYLVWSKPVYLLFVQALGLGMGVFPVRRICRALGLSPKLSTAFVFLWVLYPTLGYGCFNDFHENKFLPVCLLWMLCMVVEKRKGATLFFALLTLSVKEDAAVYVAAVGLFLLFARKERLFGALLTLLSVGYFLFAVKMIELNGGEAMISRFSSYYPAGEETLLGVFKTCFFNIGYLIKSVFSPERLEFLLWMLCPVLFAPFLAKNQWTLLLLLPLLAINLMPSLNTQYNPYYQYTYGSAALLVFIAVLVFADMERDKRRFFVTASLAVSLVFSCGLLGYKCAYFGKRALETAADCNASRALLEQIPEGASVTARDYVVPHISYIEDLHTIPVFYGGPVYTEYYVIDVRDPSHKYTQQMTEFVAADYELIDAAGFLQLWQLR